MKIKEKKQIKALEEHGKQLVNYSDEINLLTCSKQKKKYVTGVMEEIKYLG